MDADRRSEAMAIAQIFMPTILYSFLTLVFP